VQYVDSQDAEQGKTQEAVGKITESEKK